MRMVRPPSSRMEELPAEPSCREGGPREEQGDEESVWGLDSASPVSESKKSSSSIVTRGA